MAAGLQREEASLEAIERVYRARLPEFRRVAAAIGGDRELARDAVQDAFALAVRKRAGFRGHGSLEAWLWRIVVNASLSQRRGVRPTSVLPEEFPVNGRSEPDADRVRTALTLVSERQRLVLFLHYYADLDYAAIADVLEIRPGTVGATLHAARAAMRRLLEEVVR